MVISLYWLVVYGGFRYSHLSCSSQSCCANPSHKIHKAWKFGIIKWSSLFTADFHIRCGGFSPGDEKTSESSWHFRLCWLGSRSRWYGFRYPHCLLVPHTLGLRMSSSSAKVTRLSSVLTRSHCCCFTMINYDWPTIANNSYHCSRFFRGPCEVVEKNFIEYQFRAALGYRKSVDQHRTTN